MTNTVGYVSLKDVLPDQLVELILAKLGLGGHPKPTINRHLKTDN